ncbi:MAG: GNAT family N-acetyltransferase [Actinomycetota bacterium]|nr:GNAT family N-acetyltransferase [Actinomycetota bacterium]
MTARKESSSPSIELTWERRPFQELTTSQLYAILALRSEVFVVEQECVFQDVDGLDPECVHLLGWDDEGLVAYARILPADVWKPGVLSIGRIVTSPRARRRGLGAEALARALSYLRAHADALPIELESQYRLEDFYERFGFQSVGKPYIKDGQPHIVMTLDPAAGHDER